MARGQCFLRDVYLDQACLASLFPMGAAWSGTDDLEVSRTRTTNHVDGTEDVMLRAKVVMPTISSSRTSATAKLAPLWYQASGRVVFDFLEIVIEKTATFTLSDAWTAYLAVANTIVLIFGFVFNNRPSVPYHLKLGESAKAFHWHRPSTDQALLCDVALAEALGDTGHDRTQREG
eukprot:TRINITY_DN125908_c0_g1_i1.p1 TRINITY_DN125908_c0_g1~~TRINITY_DN125908_c0_g1_i1.p1  ORF type:complete len:204 (+),score=6.81 TRINITY_DN125908_c0_g1_i1:85-612(+)